MAHHFSSCPAAHVPVTCQFVLEGSSDLTKWVYQTSQEHSGRLFVAPTLWVHRHASPLAPGFAAVQYAEDIGNPVGLDMALLGWPAR